ncbi:hypothetical protein F4818DRAFT_396484 [Hypoxylon cercidicola]|nr:hypothetical protein F4818DRAFT_396484 [Hypoxylon cercidicola]
MRLQSTVVAALLWATATLAAPITYTNKGSREEQLSSTVPDLQPAKNITADLQPTMNITADPQPAANFTTDEIYGPVKCNKNFAPGKPLTKLERVLMKMCYKTLLSGDWATINCPRTDRTYETWGRYWDSTDNCLEACQQCVTEAIDALLPSVQCDMHVSMAKCRIRYT